MVCYMSRNCDCCPLADRNGHCFDVVGLDFRYLNSNANDQLLWRSLPGWTKRWISELFVLDEDG